MHEAKENETRECLSGQAAVASSGRSNNDRSKGGRQVRQVHMGRRRGLTKGSNRTFTKKTAVHVQCGTKSQLIHQFVWKVFERSFIILRMILLIHYLLLSHHDVYVFVV